MKYKFLEKLYSSVLLIAVMCVIFSHTHSVLTVCVLFNLFIYFSHIQVLFSFVKSVALLSSMFLIGFQVNKAGLSYAGNAILDMLNLFRRSGSHKLNKVIKNSHYINLTVDIHAQLKLFYPLEPHHSFTY